MWKLKNGFIFIPRKKPKAPPIIEETFKERVQRCARERTGEPIFEE